MLRKKLAGHIHKYCSPGVKVVQIYAGTIIHTDYLLKITDV